MPQNNEIMLIQFVLQKTQVSQTEHETDEQVAEI